MAVLVMRPLVRWHTFRVMLLTSMVWLIVGVCLLVYYMECLAQNAVNCNRNTQFNDIRDHNNNNQRFSDESNDYLNDNIVQKFVSNQKADNSFLPQYKANQLRPWSPRVLKSNPSHWLGENGKAVIIGKEEEDLKNENSSNPSHWLGENGKAVIIGKEEEDLKNEKFNLNKFNLLASDRIALNRSLPDVRMDGCRRKHHPKLLPSTSIIIVFHNEAWSTLLRTVHSIIRTSPEPLIQEILLVDDASERGKQLEEYVATLPVSVKVLRTGKRSGLIRARLIGAKEAKGDVLTFLDAHCECTKGWLEPLLSRIVEDRTRVVCPIIDVISDENFEYIPASDMTWGGFNW
ncbi:unnamed protein product, partial [Medioppia subpectinata]